MSIKRRETRLSHSSTLPIPIHPIQKLYKSPAIYTTTKNHIDDNITYITNVEIPYTNQIKKNLLEKKKKLTAYMIKCPKHPTENIKFIDITSENLDALCDLCITKGDYTSSTKKIERISDLAMRLRRDTVKFVEELENYNTKLSTISKDIIKTNASSVLLMTQLDDMEKRVNKLMKETFGKIRSVFLRVNPYKDVKETIKENIEDCLSDLRCLDTGDQTTLALIDKYYMNAKEIQQAKHILLKDLENRLSEANTIPLYSEKDFNILAAGFGIFYNVLANQCDKWLKTINIRFQKLGLK